MRPISRIWITLTLALGFFLGQSQLSRAAAAKKTPPENSSNTIPMQATSTVGGCVTVEAVLLPREPASKLFGGWVAENYAVVKTTISNHCADRQFILHNIYFDYSDWALSGVYKGLTPTTVCSYPKKALAASLAKPAPAGRTKTEVQPGSTATAGPGSSAAAQGDDCIQEYTQNTQGGQVATVGALDIQDQLTEDSVFSPRNLVVNGLVLVGTVAGAYTFLGSMDLTKGVSAYNSALIPGLQKFWPDRRLDQEKNVLSLGYRTDNSTAIAKDDHGSYYAFFPLAVFLVPDLEKLFLNDPAAFINPAEVLIDIHGYRSGAYSGSTKSAKTRKVSAEEGLRNLLLDLAAVVRDEKKPADDDERRDLAIKLLNELDAPCNLVKDSSSAEEGSGQVWEDPGVFCPFNPKQEADLAVLRRIAAEKYLFAHASLNVVKIVARGVMTVEVESIPATIDTVTIDNEKVGASTFTVTKSSTAAAPAAAAPAAGAHAAGAHAAAAPAGVANAASAPGGGVLGAAGGGTGADGDSAPAATGKELTGIIAGQFLTDGTPEIPAITVPGEKSPAVTDYIVDKSLEAVSAKSTDTSLAFKLQLKQTLPTGTQLTFQVSHSTGDASKGASSQTTSNKYVYTVSYEVAPKVTSVTMDKDTTGDVWGTPGKLPGTAKGADLSDATVKVTALQIGSKAATVSDYIGTVAAVTDGSTATSLDFQLTLLQAVAPGSKVTFQVTTKGGTNSYDYTVPAKVKKAAAPAKKPAAKPAPTAGKAVPNVKK
jgi:hypothetical protein